MLRRYWIGFALILSAFIGYQGYARAPGLLDGLAGALLGLPQAATAGASASLAVLIAAALTATAGFVLIFLVLAAVDGVKLGKAAAALEALRERLYRGEAPDRRSFLAAFGEADDFARLASDYAATLHAEEPTDEPGGPPPRLRATVPAVTRFGTATLVDSRLFVWFFRRLPALVSGLGALGLVLGVLDGLAAMRTVAAEATVSAAPWEPLTRGAEAGLLVLLFAAVLAVLITAVEHAVLALRYRQTSELCQTIDALFHGGAETDYLRRVTRIGAAEMAALRRAVSGASSDLRKDLARGHDRLAETVEAQSRTTGRALAGAVAKALDEPMKKLTKALETATRDESARVKELVHGALTTFTTELERKFGDQLGDVHSVLEASRVAATEMQTAVDGMAETLSQRLADQGEAFAHELRGALDAEGERHAEASRELATRLQGFAERLSRDVEEHSRRFDALLDKALARADEITRSAVATSGEDMARTAAAFSGLQTVVESLTVSVVPILNQVVDTQEQLLTALRDEAAAGKHVAGAAHDMDAAARASRETVERFVTLARALSETSRALAQASAAHEARATPQGGAEDERGASARRLSEALRKLREETRDASDELPEL